MVYFSKSKLGFYQDELKDDYIAANNWPSDLVEVSEEKYKEVYIALSNGKRLAADEDGQPIAVDRPELTPEELMADASSKKSDILDSAAKIIAPLQDAVDLEMATDEEVKLLAAWKKYRVLINRVDVSKAPNIDWPVQPQ